MADPGKDPDYSPLPPTPPPAPRAKLVLTTLPRRPVPRWDM